ncbi:MAG: hypothetical protein QOE54_2196, partial [Streptosporangiaceae bacterium]|nr:hypothetical protein [Streptosporangiaceae bacterium]
RGAGGRKRIALRRDQYQVVTLADPGDPGLHALPEQNSVIGRLTSATWIECGSIKDDPVRCGVQDNRPPFAERLVVQFESVRASMVLCPHTRHTKAFPGSRTG